MDPSDRFRFLVLVAFSDGSLGEDEKPVLLTIGREMGLDATDVVAVMDECRRGVNLPRSVPTDQGEREKLFMDMARVVVADGVVSEKEVAFLTRLAPKLGMSPDGLKENLESLVKEATAKAAQSAAAPGGGPPKGALIAGAVVALLVVAALVWKLVLHR